MGRRRKPDGPSKPRVSIGLPRDVVVEVDALLAEYPFYGATRNEFATRAVIEAVRQARKEAQERILLDAFRKGQPGSLDEVRRLLKP